jgi:hypothetical protein
MDIDALFDRLWTDYTNSNPSARKIVELFEKEGEVVVNDHIAFRTLDDPRINIDIIAFPFIRNGYVPKGEYFFEDKHLYARHYELPGNHLAPRVFISQLLLEEVSSFARKVLLDAVDKIPKERLWEDDLVYAGSISGPVSYEVYNRLREESEYAAWFYVFGFRANHFTVSVNALKKHNSLAAVNQLLKQHGFLLNNAGGEIKGNASDLLLQSSTMADIVTLRFLEGNYEVPCCYYEFAQRFPMPDGQLFSGFIAQSADKIFESTNFYRSNE